MADRPHPSAHGLQKRSTAQCRRVRHNVVLTCGRKPATSPTRRMVSLVRGCGDACRNAGGAVCQRRVQGRFERIDRYPIDDVRRLLDVNVVGVFTVLPAVSAAMIAAGRGRSRGHLGVDGGSHRRPNMSAYSATRAAVIGLTRARPGPRPPRHPRQRCVTDVHRARTDVGPAGRRPAATADRTTPPTRRSLPSKCWR